MVDKYYQKNIKDKVFIRYCKIGNKPFISSGVYCKLCLKHAKNQLNGGGLTECCDYEEFKRIKEKFKGRFKNG